MSLFSLSTDLLLGQLGLFISSCPFYLIARFAVRLLSTAPCYGYMYGKTRVALFYKMDILVHILKTVCFMVTGLCWWKSSSFFSVQSLLAGSQSSRITPVPLPLETFNIVKAAPRSLRKNRSNIAITKSAIRVRIYYEAFYLVLLRCGKCNDFSTFETYPARAFSDYLPLLGTWFISCMP